MANAAEICCGGPGYESPASAMKAPREKVVYTICIYTIGIYSSSFLFMSFLNFNASSKSLLNIACC
mgnify:CR=1 FL=1